MKTRATLLLVILSLLATSVHAADFKKDVGSGWFLEANGGWWGTWGTSKNPGKREKDMTVADVKRLKKAGFDHVRLHFHIDGLIFWEECHGQCHYLPH
ncbi:MAG: hypothetical protein QGI17_14240 [Arenicellales bacterium]|jgi:hypothetical protein|nr:hypothetical protein [Arenicellales bacterium]